jgi:hypothetical protein
MGSRANALADRFDKAVEEFARTIESVPDGKWNVEAEGGWTVGQLAEHVAGQFPLEMEYVRAAAAGRPAPGYTWDDINSKNDTRAARNRDMDKTGVLKTLRSGAADVSAFIRGLSDEQLDRASNLPLAGADVTLEQLLLSGVLIQHVESDHLPAIKAAL